VTFAALKPGLLFQPARALCGEIVIVDIGLDVSRARAHLVEASDVAFALPPRDPGTHKWRRATWVIGGSQGMTGAPQLAAMDAARALAARTGAVVLLKGPPTVVADEQDVLVVLGGDARLATAGTGDVLSGIVGALLAQGVGALDAAGIGAYVHGVAAMTCPPF